MANPLEVLSRLFGRNKDSVFLSDLHSKMSQPLFVHPQLGEMVMRSYLHAIPAERSEPMARHGDNGEYSYAVSIDGNIAVLDISGVLTAREESTPCGDAPASYETIKQDMSALLADSSIDTIVGRFDSPGGMAAQNMDLSDFIYASRNQGTKFVAMVDDMAYSAAFGIASAFDEIWVTRTSGVGSVGVVSYHVDQSEANAKAGIKVEYIYAGDKKTLGNPHEPLSEAGREEQQREVSRLYTLFTATVARNLGLTIEAVQDTQAGTFHGEKALDVGFAHKVGTFDELLGSLFAERTESSVRTISTSAKQEDVADDMVIESEAQVAPEEELIVSGDDAEQSSEEDVIADEGRRDEPIEQSVEGAEVSDGNAIVTTIESTTSAEDVAELTEDPQVSQEAIELARQHAQIRGMCMAADREAAAEAFIAAEMSVDSVREELLALTSTPESSIVGRVTSAGATISSAATGWKAALDKTKRV